MDEAFFMDMDYCTYCTHSIMSTLIGTMEYIVKQTLEKGMEHAIILVINSPSGYRTW